MVAIPVEGSSTTTTINKTYTVVKGDTLSGIAVKVTKLYSQKITWQSIASWNGIKSPYTIKVGQKLKIVIKGTATTKPTTPGTTSPGSTTGTTTSSNTTATPSALPTTILDKVIGGVILYGIYKTFQKIF